MKIFSQLKFLSLTSKYPPYPAFFFKLQNDKINYDDLSKGDRNFRTDYKNENKLQIRIRYFDDLLLEHLKQYEEIWNPFERIQGLC